MNILTKFHKDWTTIVDFLLIAKFWASSKFACTPSICFLKLFIIFLNTFRLILVNGCTLFGYNYLPFIGLQAGTSRQLQFVQYWFHDEFSWGSQQSPPSYSHRQLLFSSLQKPLPLEAGSSQTSRKQKCQLHLSDLMYIFETVPFST